METNKLKSILETHGVYSESLQKEIEEFIIARDAHSIVLETEKRKRGLVKVLADIRCYGFFVKFEIPRSLIRDEFIENCDQRAMTRIYLPTTIMKEDS